MVYVTLILNTFILIFLFYVMFTTKRDKNYINTLKDNKLYYLRADCTIEKGEDDICILSYKNTKLFIEMQYISWFKIYYVSKDHKYIVYNLLTKKLKLYNDKLRLGKIEKKVFNDMLLNCK